MVTQPPVVHASDRLAQVLWPAQIRVGVSNATEARGVAVRVAPNRVDYGGNDSGSGSAVAFSVDAQRQRNGCVLPARSGRHSRQSAQAEMTSHNFVAGAARQ